MQMSEEEIDEFLGICDSSIPQDGENIIETVKGILINKINEIYNSSLPLRNDVFAPGTIFNAPALFWVSGNNITLNLIRELEELSSQSFWSNTSDSLKQLLSIVPEHSYPDLIPDVQDKNIYVTQANSNQRRAIQAAKCEPIVVVTGPPGTGKSQLVLNLIAQSFLEGKTVLFASRNNRAVDVVMDRLQNELHFRGAVRTGNNANREKAVAQMQAALSTVGLSITNTNYEMVDEAYHLTWQSLSTLSLQLEEIRNLKGKYNSQVQEREQYLAYLPKELTKLIEESVPPFVADEGEYLLTLLPDLLEEALEIKNGQNEIQRKLSSIELGNHSDDLFVKALQNMEEQWGNFGGRFLHHKNFNSLKGLQQHLNEWLLMTGLVRNQITFNKTVEEKNNVEIKYQETQSQLPKNLVIKIPSIAERYSEAEVKSFGKQISNQKQIFSRYAEGDFSFWERLLLKINQECKN